MLSKFNKMAFNKFLITIIFLFFILIVSCNKDGKYDDFAKCLTEKGVKMYGAVWCPHCQNEKEMFGKSWQYMNYVECAAPNGGQAQACAQAGIELYPTWEFPNNEKIAEEFTIEQLSQKTGCAVE